MTESYEHSPIDWDSPINKNNKDRLEELRLQALEAERRAEKCGCGNCKGAVEAAQAAYWKEYDRQFQRYPKDHEEENLTDYALGRLFDRTEDRSSWYWNGFQWVYLDDDGKDMR